MIKENLTYNLIYIIYHFKKKNNKTFITGAQLRAINVRLHSLKYCSKNFASGKNGFLVSKAQGGKKSSQILPDEDMSLYMFVSQTLRNTFEK